MITAMEVAKILGISRQAAYNLAAPHGPIPCYRFGPRCMRFDVESVNDYLRSCRCEPLPKLDLQNRGLNEASITQRFKSAGYDNVSIRPVERRAP